MKKLPVWELTIKEDDSGVDFVALVDFPAIEKNFQSFGKERARFTVSDEKKRIITGPLMIADLPIFRRSPEKGEYYAVFSADTIEAIAQRYFKNGFHGNVNLMHDPTKQVEGVYQYESYLVNNGLLSSPKGWEDVTKPAWFGSFKVENEEVWKQVVETGELKGFSVEGYFEQRKVSDPDPAEELLAQLIEILQA
jgi:hypothetical protein